MGANINPQLANYSMPPQGQNGMANSMFASAGQQDWSQMFQAGA